MNRLKIFSVALCLLAYPLVGQQTIPLMQQRVDSNKVTMYFPMNAARGEIAALRTQGTYYWAISPVIVQPWDKQNRGLALVLRITGQETPPSSIVIIVDGKSTMLEPTVWAPDQGGGQATIIDRVDLVRGIASATTVSVTVFGATPLTGTYQVGDLAFFKSLVAMYDAGTYLAPDLSVASTTPAVQTPAAAMAPTPPKPVDAPPIPAKHTREQYLQTKVDDAAAICRQQIVEGAKDPTSVQFSDKYSYAFGRVLTRNWISITWVIMGRNTYGAVLQHTMTCNVSCIEGKACEPRDLMDEP